ncbi:response regulator transcription factor [Paenibacillus sp. NEAU-GSW1]|uniref:response regulator transcription factor n=1 Tax=Paenibacillus sp. NEAU-GSW1 TaxID=2682486 RepID=UPI0012E1A853|nr:response regulator transcription factor [Paenibacillus sp. NEAU-GSW1]MUT65160.1 response regulator [Paenibacillus sp. NEAU-GSW1]
MYTILLVEDDSMLSHMIKRLLEQNSYKVTAAYSGSEALLLLKDQAFDLLLLDLMLPGVSGENVLEYAKASSSLPVIGLSAKTDMASKINLLRQGADDYITKPFDNQELLVRIEAILRRCSKEKTTKEQILTFKDLTLNTVTLEVKLMGTPLALTRYEYSILHLLMSAPNKVFTKNNIFERIWNEDFSGSDNAINVHIGNLRKKMAAIKPDESFIQTVWGLGFKMQS